MRLLVAQSSFVSTKKHSSSLSLISPHGMSGGVASLGAGAGALAASCGPAALSARLLARPVHVSVRTPAVFCGREGLKRKGCHEPLTMAAKCCDSVCAVAEGPPCMPMDPW